MATETRKPTAAIAPFGLRMQPELRAKIEAAAQLNGRSMNAEIVSRLEQSFSFIPDLTEAIRDHFISNDIDPNNMKNAPELNQSHVDQLKNEIRALRFEVVAFRKFARSAGMKYDDPEGAD